MSFRISPLWYPLLIVLSPIILPFLIWKNYKFKKSKKRVSEVNTKRINLAKPINLTEIDSLEISVLVEWKTKDGFLGDAGVSYLFNTENDSILYDIGFGAERPALLHNSNKLNLNLNSIDYLAISHLHPDHMGGMKATKIKKVIIPEGPAASGLKGCFVPDKADTNSIEPTIIKEPQLLSSTIATTGPLASNLFMFGYTEEQIILFKLKDKGLVIFTGCGHPGIETILKMVRKISSDPIYAIGGGFHLPITNGRGNRLGIEFQRIIGTGKPPWQKLNIEDLNRTIHSINEANPKKVYLSAHDTCDYSLNKLSEKLNAETHILRAGDSFYI